MAVAARESSRLLQAMPAEERSKILICIADALEANEKVIIHENEADVAAAQDDGYESSLVSRLAPKPGKVSSIAKAIRVLTKMEEPIGQVLKRTKLSHGFILEKRSSPLGVLLVIFESWPEALVEIITSCIPKTVSKELIGFVTSREEIPELLKLDDVIDLVIPRGSNELVYQIKSSTQFPVLGHAGVSINGGPEASSVLNLPPALSFHHEYSSLACPIEIVDDVHAAIDHIHKHGSVHTDCIVTEDPEAADIFLRQVDRIAR